MIIYKTTNLLNGKIYIGQDSKNDPNYLGSGKTLKRAINKYGKNNFTKEIIEICETKKDLNDREIYWIGKMDSRNRKIGYNISKGGAEGDRETGFKIVKKGIYTHWVEKYGESEAKKRLEIQKNKISKFNKENKPDLITKGRYQIWVEKYGKDVADIKQMLWKKKISDYQQEKLKNGWKHSDETKEKIKKFSKDRLHSKETKLKMKKPKPIGFGEKISKIKKGISTGPSKQRLEINQIDLNGFLIKTWESISSAEKELKIYNISAVCKNKQETAGGYIWRYKTNN